MVEPMVEPLSQLFPEARRAIPRYETGGSEPGHEDKKMFGHKDKSWIQIDEIVREEVAGWIYRWFSFFALHFLPARPRVVYLGSSTVWRQ